MILKSILVGTAASILAVIVSGIAAIAILGRYPQLAVRIFPAQNFDIVVGSHYYVNFPLWQIVAVGIVAFVIGFVWTLR
jgi:hypothetical protein